MKDTSLYNKERHQKILELIRQNGSVTVVSLAELFHVTTATIRADLSLLESAGALTRTHGGAITKIYDRIEPKIHERHNEDEKKKIASEAVKLIKENDILLLDTGTTIVSLAKALVASNLTQLTIFSNDIDVIRILEEKEQFSLHLLPGKIRNGFHYCHGSLTSQTLYDCHFNKLFLSTSSISIKEGLTTQNPELAQLKRIMINTADEIILLSDSSKLHHVDFQKFASLEQIDTLIMDSDLSDEDSDKLKNSVKNLILV